jgi:septal ring-binding cell division protein DamX
MTDEQRGSEVYRPESTDRDRRRWWEKQRWLVPIAVVVLILAVIAVTAFLRSERAEAPDAAIAEDEAAQAESEGGTQAQASPEPPAGGDDAEQQQQDRETAQVCRRIVALQEEVQSEGINGMNPLDVYTELTEIERQARGTQLASLANDAAVSVQRFITGRTDADAVYAAGTALASAC